MQRLMEVVEIAVDINKCVEKVAVEKRFISQYGLYPITVFY
jgi:hypothetical protein